MRIEGSTALVTGANRGLGCHLAQDLLARGARVCAAARAPASVDLPGVTPVARRVLRILGPRPPRAGDGRDDDPGEDDEYRHHGRHRQLEVVQGDAGPGVDAGAGLL